MKKHNNNIIKETGTNNNRNTNTNNFKSSNIQNERITATKYTSAG